MPLTENLCTEFDCDSDGFHEVLSPCPPSFRPFDPPDSSVLCSFVSDLSCDVDED